MLADYTFPDYDLLKTAELAQDNVHSISNVLGWIAIPLALLPPIPVKWKWIWIRILAITVIVWFVQMAFRIAYDVPWSRIVMDIEK